MGSQEIAYTHTCTWNLLCMQDCRTLLPLKQPSAANVLYKYRNFSYTLYSVLGKYVSWA